jgi:hypothetical protein
MHSRIDRRLVGSVASLALVVGCAHSYTPASIDEPHANVQVRVIHHAELGPNYDEDVRINGSRIPFTASTDGVRTTTMRLRPGGARYDFHTEFFHTETRWEQQPTSIRENLRCGSTQFGPQYCTYEFPATRRVPVLVNVPDGGCETHVELEPLPGAEYLVQYELVGSNVCEATCQRLVREPGGTLLARGCGAGEPATNASVPPEELPTSGTAGSETAPR